MRKTTSTPNAVFERIWPAVISCLLLIASYSLGLEAVAVAWSAYLLLLLILRRRATLGILLFVAITLYATTAWMVQQSSGQRFDPWPPLELVRAVTLEDLRAIILAHVLVEVLIGLRSIDGAVRGASARFRAALGGYDGNVFDHFLCAVLIVIGGADTLKLLQIGVGEVLTARRRTFATDLILSGDHNVQLLVMAATIVLASRLVLGRVRIFPVLAILICWLPYFLTGSRKELLIVVVVVVLVVAPIASRAFKALAITVAAAGAVLPLLKTSDWLSPLHEVILPQYMQFSVSMGLVPPDLGGTFLERAQFLLPSELRLTHLEDFGLGFGALGVTGTGVGASPFAEAQMMNGASGLVLTFAILFVLAVLPAALAARRFPALTLVSFALLLFYGRSDLWTYLFFALYIALLVTLFAKLATSSRWQAAAEPSPARFPTGHPFPEVRR
jgi:hypothetical protein